MLKVVFQLSSDQNPGWCLDTGEQQSYMGIIISKYKDPCEPTSIMECHRGFERYLNSLCERRKRLGAGGNWNKSLHNRSRCGAFETVLRKKRVMDQVSSKTWWIFWQTKCGGTVDGRNPALPGMYKNHGNNGIDKLLYQPQLVQDFVHQP